MAGVWLVVSSSTRGTSKPTGLRTGHRSKVSAMRRQPLLPLRTTGGTTVAARGQRRRERECDQRDRAPPRRAHADVKHCRERRGHRCHDNMTVGARLLE